MSEFSFSNDEYRLKVLDRLNTWERVVNEIIANYKKSRTQDIWFLNQMQNQQTQLAFQANSLSTKEPRALILNPQ
jgi:hypothetical protein